MSKVAPRSLAPFLKWVRDFLLGREFVNSLRFQDFVATRSPPPPNLPEGPSHKLYNNYYFTRDGRHVARPPVVLLEDTKRKALIGGAKENAENKAVTGRKLGHVFPGKPYDWEQVSK
ncbi:hypothetical protein JTE90_029518 [Oedothorax gibbosus]|uniref:NADH dehydrogenase [ubiquinone] 1 alpha subcomplex subunit 7 n=1 Tax=Oedothorax gibbosus TaxID=931172 RepID=A0AAV6UFB0_9ARAC|nr:hypothetical protein JTE90_029518 [Oedothorax gibbosus]